MSDISLTLKTFPSLRSVVESLLSRLPVLVAMLGLMSCYEAETVIHLNKDGSGTMVQDVRSPDGIKIVVNDRAGENTTPGVVDSLGFHDDDLRKNAAEMGEGVSFEKVEQLGPHACRITFKFTDINKLGIPTGFFDTPSGTPGPEMKKSERTTFAYAAGKLTVRLPKAQEKEAPNPTKTEVNAEQDAALIKLESGIKIKVSLEVEGGIAKTDATYAEEKAGEKVIRLIDLDFSKLTKDPGAFKKLMEESASFRNFEKASKGMDGARMEPKDEVEVILK